MVEKDAAFRDFEKAFEDGGAGGVVRYIGRKKAEITCRNRKLANLREEVRRLTARCEYEKARYLSLENLLDGYDLVPKLDGHDEREPHYYVRNGVHLKNVMRAMMTDVELGGSVKFWWGDALKRVWRWPLKDGVKDIDKAIEDLRALRDEITGPIEPIEVVRWKKQG